MELDAQFGKLTMASNATDAVKQRDLPYFSGLPRIRLPTEQQKAKKKKKKNREAISTLIGDVGDHEGFRSVRRLSALCSDSPHVGELEEPHLPQSVRDVRFGTEHVL